ncbi:hep_Hag family [Micractinium conductrix]|uniref:Hep_Hag family n=1 Tax=Micractinium conductrix TaxID=554055 RepID=A0A2P6UZB1_9CHLO|nr:hep_Hag family [Micractinium conductrix]|eukprot:PSC67176.1 hep_Hag family [Micractinium conductrix]
MVCDAAPAADSARPAASASQPAACSGPAPAHTAAEGGQHHLLRHVLSPEQCSDALHHFNTNDSKAAARQVNRMSQRELRDMFAKVYNVHTNSNNNTWLRRKLLEAVGASRRFYAAAASRAGRSRPKKASADGGSHATAAAPKPRAPKAHHAEPHVLHCRGGQAAPPSFGSHGSAGGGHVAHHVLPPGPALPAGSPRALSHRPRRAALGSASALGDASHYGAASYGAACFGGAPYPAYPQAPCQPQRRQCYVYPAAQHSDDTCSGSVGSEAHPAAIGSPRSWDSTSPTSAFAAAHPQPLMHPSAAAMPSNGSYSSLHSSQSPAPLPLRAPSLGLGLGLGIGGDVKPPSLPQMASFGALAALLSGGPADAPQGPLAALQPGPSACLDALWVPCDALPPAPSKPAEDWLTWDDWQLPSLL